MFNCTTGVITGKYNVKTLRYTHNKEILKGKENHIKLVHVEKNYGMEINT